MKRIFVTILAGLGLAALGNAQMPLSPWLYSPATGKYLGNLNSNQFDMNSVSNPYGQYGSRYSPDSINNVYGMYGSYFSPYSIRNPYATQAPIIVSPYGGWSMPEYTTSPLLLPSLPKLGW